MDFLDFTREMTTARINSGKKHLRVNYGCFLLNMGLFFWNCWNIYSSSGISNWAAGFGAGVTGIGAFYCWLTTWDIRLDVKIDKDYLLSLKKCKDDEINKGILEQYKNSIQSYKDALEKLESVNK